MTTRSPNIFVVGSGPVATALAGGLRLAGVPVLGLWARRPAGARAAAAAAGVAAYSSAPPDLLLEADVLLFAVRDGATHEVAIKLLGTGLVDRHHVLLHCSGASSATDAFAPVLDRVGGVGTLHPLRAVADARAVMRSWRGTVFGVEGDGRGRAVAQQLAGLLGGTALALDGNAMARYHAAAALASNYVVSVIDAAVGLLRDAGIAEQAALPALVALARGALTNVEEQGLVDGLTGPIRRGDVGTVERHLTALAEQPAVAELYKVLARRTLRLAAEGGNAAADDLAAIERLLGSGAAASESAA